MKASQRDRDIAVTERRIDRLTAKREKASATLDECEEQIVRAQRELAWLRDAPIDDETAVASREGEYDDAPSNLDHLATDPDAETVP